MLKNNVTRNFLFLISGMTILFCAAIPDLARTASYAIAAVLYYAGFGWLADLLNISLILLVLGGLALTTLGIVFTILDNTKAKRPVNWIVVGCAGGGVIFTLIALVPFLFWLGIVAAPAFVVAAVFAFKDAAKQLKNPASVIAALIMVFMLIGMWDRDFNVKLGWYNWNYIGAVVAVAAFICIAVFKGRLASKLDAAGQSAFTLILVGSIIYAVASLFNIIPILSIVGFIAAIAAWIVYLIGFIKLMGSKSFGQGNKGGMFLLIAHGVGILGFLPLFNVAALAGFAFGFLCLIDGLEEQKA